MNKYITFRDNDNDGVLQYYILQREFPHYVGLISSIPIPEAMCCSPIPGYNMYVVFSGTLRGNIVPSYKDIVKEIESVFDDMATWYYSERIMKDEKKYKKFKIITNGQQEKI